MMMNDEINRITNEHKRQKWRRWIIRQTLQNDSPSTLPKSDRQLFQPTFHHFKAGETHFFPGDTISGVKAEIVDLNSDIYNRPSK